MTITEAITHLYGFFSKTDVFCLEEDFKKIVLISEDESRDKAAIRAALDAMTEAHIVAPTMEKKKEFWTLQQPLSSLSQPVEVSAMTAHAVATIVNEYIKQTGSVKLPYANPLALKSEDIDNLLTFCSTLISELTKGK